MGYKLDVVKNDDIIKRQLLADIVSELYFSRSSDFFEEEYKKGIINDPVEFELEATKEFSHALLIASSEKIDVLKDDILKYIENIKLNQIDHSKFELIKKKMIGSQIALIDNYNYTYRKIIDSIVNETNLYGETKILKEINENDIKEFLKLFTLDNLTISTIYPNN